MFEIIITPRISETDLVGHINNTTLPVWFEAARYPIFHLFNPNQDYKDWKMIVVKTTLEYKRQIFFGKDVVIRTWVKHIGNTSLRLYEELYQGDLLCAVNEAVYVNFNLATQQSESIPPHIKKELLQHFYEEQSLQNVNDLN
ncbi:acyl-CoA thioesterase [Lysinibacillus sp. LZ02]|uniref:acyl-CoA thioesterase n=1 Tax=Lysinibacillus sp. LZ02 TaxID=3420668 RepID=UPI003D36CDD7